VALDAGRDLVEVALQHVDDVVGQQRLGEAREAADVGEEDADRQLLADRAGTALGPAAPAAAQAAAHHRLGMAAPPTEVGLLQVAVEDQAATVTPSLHLAGEAELGAEAQPATERPVRGAAAHRSPPRRAGRADGVPPQAGERDPGAKWREARTRRTRRRSGRQNADGRHGSQVITVRSGRSAPHVADRTGPILIRRP
jgi:hypothetical protein